MTQLRIGGRRWLAAAAAALAAGGAAILAQTQAKPAAEPPQARIKSGVELVTTPLTIRDRKGQFLPDVKPNEIEVYEDGARQTIAAFSLSHGGRLFNVTPLPQAAQTEGIVLPRMHPVKDASGRVFVIFVDDLHFEASQTPRVRDLFERVTKRLIHEGDLFGIVSTGTSSIQTDLTYDRRRLDLAKEKILGSAPRVRDILDLSSGGNVPPEIRHRVHVAFSTAYDLLNNATALSDRRKSFIFISNGYDLDPFPEERAKREKERLGDANENPFAKQNAFSDADLVSQLSELTRAARRANVAIYAIDPRGLVGGPDISEQIDMAAYQRHVSKTQDTLRVIAEQTGGKAVVNKNDFDAALDQIDAETSDYYVVGYYASNTDPSKRRRTIEIKVRRPDVVVTHRTEYELKPRTKN